MRSKNVFLSLSVLCLVGLLVTNGCKKKAATTPDTTTTAPTETGQSSSDSKNTQSENDAAIGEINDVIAAQPKLQGRSSSSNQVNTVTGNVCGYTVDSVNINQGSVKLNYNGTTCSNRTRTGAIRLTLLKFASGQRWKMTGAVIQVDFLSFKVTRASDGKSVMLAGTQFLTNVSGGTWWELIATKTQSALVSTVTGTNLSVTFEDNKTATYNINRRITYTYPANILTCVCEGIGVSNSLNNLENFGTTRDGDAFTSQVSTPISWNQTCGPWAPLQGKVNINVANKGFLLSVTYGVDVNGNAVTVGANSCPYGWRLDYTYNNTPKTSIFGYL